MRVHVSFLQTACLALVALSACRQAVSDQIEGGDSSSALQQGSDSPARLWSIGGGVVNINPNAWVAVRNGNDVAYLYGTNRFTLRTQYVNATPYDVTVAGADPSLQCTITNNTGLIANAPVTDVAVVCTAVPVAQFVNGFETFDRALDWSNTVDNTWGGGGLSDVVGYCCAMPAPQAMATSNESAHTGTGALVYSGWAASPNSPQAYLKTFDLSTLSLAGGAYLSYWIFPQSNASQFGGAVTAKFSAFSAVDIDLSDGTAVRFRPGIFDQFGQSPSPAAQGNLVLDSWNFVLVDLSSVALEQLMTMSIGWQQTGQSGGYRGYLDDVIIDYTPPTPSRYFATSWEAYQTLPTWADTIDAATDGGNMRHVVGLCCGASGPQAHVTTEMGHTGSRALVYAGRSDGGVPGYAYMKVLDLSHSNFVLNGLTTLSYWVYPQSAATFGAALGANSASVAIDLIFADGDALRYSGLTDVNGLGVTPSQQSEGLEPDTWNLVQIPLGALAGKVPVRLDVGWTAAMPGGYRGLVDDITLGDGQPVVVGRPPSLVRVVLAPAHSFLFTTALSLVATGIYSDGTQKALSENVVHTSSDATVATVDINGLVTTHAYGTALIRATSNGVTSAAYVVTVTPPSFALGGTVAGLLSGTRVQVVQGRDHINVGNGSFTFPTFVPGAGIYSASLTNPTGQTCAFTGGTATGTMPSADTAPISISCSVNRYSLGGNVSGLISSTNISLSDGNDTLSIANGPYTFPTSLPYQRAYSIGLTNPTGQTCAFNPNTAGAGTMSHANVTNANVACTTNTYPLGGTVTGLVTGNVTLTNTVNGDVISVGNGSYLFDQNIPYAGSYNVVTTSPGGLNCVVANGSSTMPAGGSINVLVSCTPKTYTLGGSITGLLGNTNVTLLNGSDNIATPNGNFTFPTSVAYNSNYSAALTSPNGQTCVFIGNSNAGVMPPNNNANIILSCTTNLYSLGGVVTGLLSNTNVILTDGNDTVGRTNGSYTFPTLLPYQRAYSIGISNPAGQTCAFNPNAAGAGTVGYAPVTNANVLCTTNTYPLGGTVTGLVTGNVTLTNTVNADVVSVGNGNYLLDQNIAYTGNYNIVTTSPAGLNCVVANGNSNMPPGGNFNVSVTCTPKTYTLGGSIAGLLSNTNVTLVNGSDNIATSNGNFTFPTSVAYNSNYSATLTSPVGQTCAFTSNSNVGVMPPNNNANIIVACTTNLYSLGGAISGLLSNTNVTLADGNDTVSRTNGSYAFPTSLPYQRAYSIGIASPTGQTCAFNPNAAGAGTMSNANVTNANVVCTTNTYPLGGTATGLVTGNVTLTNTVNADVISVGNGNYLFDQNIVYAGNYNIVTTSPGGLSCVVANGNSNMPVGGNFNVLVTCTPKPYTLGGSITGLLSNANVTLLNGSDNIATSNGNFTFPTSVAYNSNYSAALTSPNGQTCVFTGNSNAGVMPPNNNANIIVSCTANLYSLGGAITGLLSNTNVVLTDGNDTVGRTNGSYTFPTLLPYQRAYSIGISNPAGQTCAFNPNAAGAGTVGYAPVTNANVVCTTNTYPLGGAVTGLVSGNVTLTNTVNADAISVGNGNYLFDQNVSYTGNYNIVTTSPNGLTCVVSNGATSMPVGGNFNVNVTCTTNPATRLTLTAYATPRVAGQNSNVTITAYDASNNVAIGYTGVVHISSTDANAAFNPNFTFITAYAGSANVPITMKTAGTQALTGNDITTPSVAGRQNSILVNPAAASALKVSGYTTPRTAGQNGNMTVTAYDAYANIATGYGGTVHITSTDTSAVKPADYAFQTGDAGVASLPVTLASAGTWSISANDTSTASIAGMQNLIVVNPNAAVLLTVTGYTSPRVAGQQGNITVTAYDAYGNVATAYAGTVHVSSTDASAIKPADYTFSGAGGVASLPITLVTAGTRAISANDTTTVSIAGNQNSIVVQPNVTVKFIVSGFPNPIYARAAGNITIVPYDNYNNIVTSYAGNVVVTSSDGAATLPATAAYASPLVATLRTPGLQSITATDQSTASINGQQPNILVNDPNYYAIGGRMTGLYGSLQLQNNGSDTVTINANGPYFMPTSVSRGATYSLTISTQPTGQTCSFANASGTVVNANVVNANVTCVYINYALGGSVSGLEPSTSVVLANGSDTVTVSANGGFFLPMPVYYAQNYNITISTNPNIATCMVRTNSGTMPNSNNTTAQVICTPTVSVTNNQAATLFLGQSSSTGYSYPGTNAATSSTAGFPYGNGYYSLKSGRLYLSDSYDNRILIYNPVPSAGSGAAASAQMGQSNFANNGSGLSSTTFSYPSGIGGDGNTLWVADTFNNRVLGYLAEPTATTAADIVLGQSTFTAGGSACSGNGITGPSSVSVVFGRLIIADSGNNRVLIWNSLPTSNGQNADLVVGQSSLTTCTAASPLATNMNSPDGVWADGKRLLVSDTSNNRVLLWNNFESITTGQAADIVLGQSSMTTRTSGVSATAINTPVGVTSDGVSIFVTEKVNNRVDVWSSFPTSNGATISKILGQSSTTANTGAASSTGLNQAQGAVLIKHNLLITDLLDNRWVGYGF